jgi:hypothetical protein
MRMKFILKMGSEQSAEFAAKHGSSSIPFKKLKREVTPQEE